MDSRIERTRRKVKNGVLKIYGNQPLENYPIAFLCKEIGLNRTTFYIHYSCIEDVVEEIANDTLTEIKDLIKDKLDHPNLLADAIVDYMLAHTKLIKLIVNESKLKWINGTLDIFKDMISNSIHFKSIYDKSKKEYTINFVIYGSYGVIAKWISEDFKENKTTIVKRLIRFIRIGE